MLLNLVITNFAIIDRLEVEFGPGFNALTGETGAGKSIILDAFGLLLGDRARPDLVRAGADQATVEALFQVEDEDGLAAILREADLPGAEDDELILRRVVQSGGRSRAYVNGALVTLAQLQPLAERLVAVCGQHEHQALRDRDSHLEFLDHFGGHWQDLQAYREVYHQLRHARERLEQLEQADRDRQQRLDFLRYQSKELAAANLDPDEEETLLAERRLLQNAETLAGVTAEGYATLYAEDGAVCEQLVRLADDLEGLAEAVPELSPLAEAVRRAHYELEDVAVQLREQGERASFEPGQLDVVEARLDDLNRLKRKYAPTVREMITLQGEVDAEIDALVNADARREALQRECDQLAARVQAAGTALAQHRERAAEGLSAAVAGELDDLAMAGARFEVRLLSLPEPGPAGLEKVEFLVSPNPGEPVKPIAKVVSGGELSRLMLALKRVAPGVDEVPTLVFDEVDAGIGGETATMVGRKLLGVSRGAQVLCVTHLPQVAAFADRQYRVFKREVEGRTLTGLQPLAAEERIKEMARMLGGAQVTEQTLRHARELLAGSNRDGGRRLPPRPQEECS